MNRYGPRASICFLTNAYPDPFGPDPAYGRFIKELVDELMQNGLAVSVVTPRLFQDSRPYESKKEVRVYRFRFWSDNRRLIEYRRIPILRMLTYLVSGLATGLNVVRKDSCRLIHGHWALPSGLIAVAVGRLLKKPVVLTIHGSDARWALEKKGLFGALFAMTVKRADVVTAVSHNIADRIRVMGVDRQKVLVFPMGVPEAFFSFPEAGHLPLEDQGTTTILSNRHLLPLYDIECLIRAIPHVVSTADRVRFLIAGQGERKRALEAMVRQSRVETWVRFCGPIDHVEMPGVLKSSHIYVSTSPADGTSVSLLEAMACGLFPIVTDIPANREWIRDGDNGFLFPPGNEGVLAEKVRIAIDDKSMRERAQAANIDLIRQGASWEEVGRRLTRVYQRLSPL
jgi:glycosyltransferase involved in cell wall biosynthesis